MQNKRGRIEIVFTLLSPLSHIGESVGPDSYLSTQDIIGPDGAPVEVFAYSGNAIRGMLRDAGARYFLRELGEPALSIQVPLEVFYLLFSGGSIGGDSKVDIDQARRIRQIVPHLSIFGGGVGNQILPGKINIGYAYPVCEETSHILPSGLKAGKFSWRQMTTEQSFTRTDDAKDDLLRPFIIDDAAGIAPAAKQTSLMEPVAETQKPKDRPQQMRYTIELMIAGTTLWTAIDYYDMTELELGALVAAIDEWGKRPVLGGQARIGMGKVSAEMTIYGEDGTSEPFVSIDTRNVSLHRAAAEPKEMYDAFLAQYKQHLQLQSNDIIRGISAKAGEAR